MDLALMTEPQMGGTYQQLLTVARFAEETGLASFARSDHYLWPSHPREATDAWATLGGLARETKRIRLCVLVTPITFRHPGVIAKTAATIDEMSGGRLDLGVGTGWMAEEHEALGLPFPEWSERFARLEESLQYLRAAFDKGEFHGDHYQLSGVDIEPKPSPSMAIIVGGQGPRRTPRLAGTHADEFNHFIAPAAVLAEHLTAARRVASEAGRRPGLPRFSVMGPVVVGKDEASFRRRLEEAASARGRSAAEHRDRLVELGVPAGTSAQVKEALAALEEIGVEKYYVQFLDLADLPTIQETFEALLG
ncbi:MAG: LLM class flavin-dependent oxidoreductase [Acidimicrobiia bacterium]